jgi:hypothetical protein
MIPHLTVFIVAVPPDFQYFIGYRPELEGEITFLFFLPLMVANKEKRNGQTADVQ